MGTVVVAALAAVGAALPPVATITETRRRISSVAIADTRLIWFSAHLYSTETFSPSPKPSSFSPWRNPRNRSVYPSGDAALRNPITGNADSARAGNGHAAAAPPTSVM